MRLVRYALVAVSNNEAKGWQRYMYPEYTEWYQRRHTAITKTHVKALSRLPRQALPLVDRVQAQLTRHARIHVAPTLSCGYRKQFPIVDFVREKRTPQSRRKHVETSSQKRARAPNTSCYGGLRWMTFSALKRRPNTMSLTAQPWSRPT